MHSEPGNYAEIKARIGRQAAGVALIRVNHNRYNILNNNNNIVVIIIIIIVVV